MRTKEAFFNQLSMADVRETISFFLLEILGYPFSLVLIMDAVSQSHDFRT